MVAITETTDYADLKTAVNNNDWEKAFLAVHTLKGMALNLGLSALASASSNLTEELRGGLKSESAALNYFSEVTDLRWDFSHNLLFSCSHDETTRVFGLWGNNKTWNEINRPQVHGYPINSIACINFGENTMCKIISASEEKVLRMFNPPFNIIKFLKELSKKDINFKNEILMNFMKKNIKM